MLAVIRVSAVPTTAEDRARLFDTAGQILKEAAETAKSCKAPVLRMIWDFGNLPLDPRLQMPVEWTMAHKTAMQEGLVRSAVIVRDLVSKKMVQTWQGLMSGADELPPSKIFRDNKCETIDNITYSLGAWDAYNYAIRGDRVGKFDKECLARILRDPVVRRGYLAPWRAPLRAAATRPDSGS